MAYEVDSQNVGLGYVAPRPVIRKNIEAFSNALNKIDAKAQEALKQRTAIQTALSQVELDSSEDEWKAKYIQDIKDKIDNEAKGGDYSRTLNTAIQLAGDALSSPELLGRQRAYKDREEQWKLIQSRNDIDVNTKHAWDISNKYHYEDKYDETTGRLIGGSKWSANWTPVSTVNDVERIAKYISLIAPEQQSTQNSKESKKTNADGTGYGGGKSSSNQFQKLTKSRIHAQLKNALDSDQDWRNSLLQRQKVNSILKEEAELKLANTVNALERENLQEQINNYNEYLTDENGINASPYEIMYKLNKTIIDNFAYNHTSTARSVSSMEDDYSSRGGSGSGAGGSQTANGDFVPTYTESSPINDNLDFGAPWYRVNEADAGVRNVTNN